MCYCASACERIEGVHTLDDGSGRVLVRLDVLEVLAPVLVLHLGQHRLRVDHLGRACKHKHFSTQNPSKQTGMRAYWADEERKRHEWGARASDQQGSFPRQP